MGNTVITAQATDFTVTLNPEKWRVRFYLFFWTMCILAIVMTQIFVLPILAAGAPPDTPPEQLGCGPFNREGWGGLKYGDGFDFAHTHLIQAFGFANICANWDYSPSREITGMYFPLFEYSFVIYLVLDYAAMKLAYLQGEIPVWFWKLVNYVTPLCIVFVVMFRMIFVFKAYEDVQGHTAGFLGMQIALLLVAVMNVLYVALNPTLDYSAYGISNKTLAIIAYVYLLLDGFITLVKIYGTVIIVFFGTTPDYFFYEVGSTTLGRVIDLGYMLFNAFIPLVIAYVRSATEEGLTVKVTALPRPVAGTPTETSQLIE